MSIVCCVSEHSKRVPHSYPKQLPLPASTPLLRVLSKRSVCVSRRWGCSFAPEPGPEQLVDAPMVGEGKAAPSKPLSTTVRTRGARAKPSFKGTTNSACGYSGKPVQSHKENLFFQRIELITIQVDPKSDSRVLGQLGVLPNKSL